MPLSSAVPVTTGHYAQAVPGHNRWHPDIPAVAEVISGGSVRMDCQGRSATGSAAEDDDPASSDPASDVMLCGPISILGAEPGDILVIDILGVGRGEAGDADAHPGIIGCAPAAEIVTAAPGDVTGVLLGHVRPADYPRIAAQAVRTVTRGREVARCLRAPLVTGSRVLLPVHTRGAKLSVGDLHFPARAAMAGAGGDACRGTTMAGWIDLRINLTKRGMERFRVTAPMQMSEPAGP